MIEIFDKEYSFLSNFNFSPIEFANKHWNTVEHLYQSAKTLDIKEKENIRLSGTPGKAKQLGKKVTLRNDWNEIKIDVMELCIELKFRQNPKLLSKLLNTEENILIEGNYWHDNFWGNCYCDKCKSIEGLNNLGKILMKIRNSYQ